jgi:catechol 2,3-dioxygenase-like lactoylglutathione lyase family enzyme
MKIALTSIFVDDPLKAFKFYTEVLGFVQQTYIPEAYLAIVVSPEQPDGTALLLEPNGNLGAKEFQEGIYKAGLPVIIFGVEDVQKEYEKLKDRGVVFTQEPTKTEWASRPSLMIPAVTLSRFIRPDHAQKNPGKINRDKRSGRESVACLY